MHRSFPVIQNKVALPLYLPLYLYSTTSSQLFPRRKFAGLLVSKRVADLLNDENPAGTTWTLKHSTKICDFS